MEIESNRQTGIKKLTLQLGNYSLVVKCFPDSEATIMLTNDENKGLGQDLETVTTDALTIKDVREIAYMLRCAEDCMKGNW